MCANNCLLQEVKKCTQVNIVQAKSRKEVFINICLIKFPHIVYLKKICSLQYFEKEEEVFVKERKPKNIG